MPETLQEQLVKHLTDVHSIEEQALLQMRVAPRMARDPELARAFREHIAETEEQKRLVSGRLEAHAAEPSKVKDLVARAGGVGMVLFARSQPDTPGKLVAHAYSYEHMELAAYELLAIVARRAGDAETAEVAGSIREQEAAMGERLATGFDRAVEASLRDVPTDDLGKQLGKYLSDAHAIESQALQLLEQGQAIAGEPNLKKVFEDHLEETRSQQAAVEARLAARDEGAVARQEHRDADRRPEPRRLLRRPTRLTGQAGRLCVRLRTSRGCCLRAAHARRTKSRRRGDSPRGRTHRSGGARRRGGPPRSVRAGDGSCAPQAGRWRRWMNAGEVVVVYEQLREPLRAYNEGGGRRAPSSCAAAAVARHEASYDVLETPADAAERGRILGANRLAILIPCHRVTRGREVPVEYVGGAAQRQRLLQFERP